METVQSSVGVCLIFDSQAVLVITEQCYVSAKITLWRFLGVLVTYF